MKPRFALAALVITASSASYAAGARDKCIAASLDAQTLKLKGELHAARDKFQSCARDTCPKLVRHDCNDWLEKVASAMPTIVLGAHDRHGKDLIDVRVSLDGAPLGTRLDGKPVEIDPGSHTLHFEMDGVAPVDQSILVRESEKDRLVTVAMGPEPVAIVAPVVRESSGPSVWTWIVGGAGLASFAVTGVAGGVSLGQWQSLHDGCAVTHSCAPGDVSAVNTLYDVAYTTAAIGGVLVIAGIVMYFTTRHTRAEITPAANGGAFAIHF